MPQRNLYRHYDLDQSKRKTANVATFGGVDYSKQKFNVDSSRAIDLLNFVYKDGVVQKRNGYEEVFKVNAVQYKVKPFDSDVSPSATVYTNDVNINSIWKFKAEDGNEHYIAHIGKLLFQILNIGTDLMTITPITFGMSGTYPLVYEFENFKSQAFVGSNRLWFLGGNQFVCIRFTSLGELRMFPVANKINSGDETEDTFVPTTTIGICYANAKSSGRSGLDYTNLLTMYRKNMCITGVGKNETEKTQTKYYEYTLDAPLITKDLTTNNDNKNMANVIITLKENGGTNV